MRHSKSAGIFPIHQQDMICSWEAVRLREGKDVESQAVGCESCIASPAPLRLLIDYRSPAAC
ncbi:MAG: hypothetical protein R6X07_09215, partial [Desulfatiglandales bacterium]